MELLEFSRHSRIQSVHHMVALFTCGQMADKCPNVTKHETMLQRIHDCSREGNGCSGSLPAGGMSSAQRSDYQTHLLLSIWPSWC